MVTSVSCLLLAPSCLVELRVKGGLKVSWQSVGEVRAAEGLHYAFDPNTPQSQHPSWHRSVWVSPAT